MECFKVFAKWTAARAMNGYRAKIYGYIEVEFQERVFVGDLLRQSHSMSVLNGTAELNHYWS